MKKTQVALSVAMLVGSASVSADTMTAGQFLMLSPGGGAMGNFTDVTGDIGGGTWSVASPSPFFGFTWTAHSGTTFGPGTYTFDTIEGGVYTNVVVGAGQVGGHILFNWNTAADIDVVNVWDVAGDVYSSVAVTSGTPPVVNGQPGLAMIDGAFPGMNANFNFTAPAAVPVPAAVWLFGSGLLGLVGVARRKKSA